MDRFDGMKALSYVLPPAGAVAVAAISPVWSKVTGSGSVAWLFVWMGCFMTINAAVWFGPLLGRYR